MSLEVVNAIAHYFFEANILLLAMYFPLVLVVKVLFR